MSLDVFAIFLVCIPIAASDGIDILGQHYSPRLRDLILKAEKVQGKKIVFQRNPSGGDNANRDVGSHTVISIRSGSPEDDVAHEVLHSILSAEGYPRMFAVRVIPISELIHPFIVADLDHLIINQRLLTEGYDALGGFLSNLRKQYINEAKSNRTRLSYKAAY